MKRRPWPIVIIACITFFMPFVNIYINAKLNRVSPLFFTQYYIENNNIFTVFAFFGLFPLAATFIYLMKKWSYPLFIIIFIYLFIQSYRNWTHYFSDIFSYWVFIVLSISYIFVVSYYFLPSVRRIYFNKRLRWWENKPRYFIQWPGKIIYHEKELPCEIIDISEGGTFIHCPENLTMQDNVMLDFSYNGQTTQIRGKLVHSRGQNPNGYGIEFITNALEKRAIKSVIKALHKSKIPHRNISEPAWESFKVWIKNAIRGKDLIP